MANEGNVVKTLDVKLHGQHLVGKSQKGNDYDFYKFSVVLPSGAEIVVKVSEDASSLLYEKLN